MIQQKTPHIRSKFILQRFTCETVWNSTSRDQTLQSVLVLPSNRCCRKSAGASQNPLRFQDQWKLTILDRGKQIKLRFENTLYSCHFGLQCIFFTFGWTTKTMFVIHVKKKKKKTNLFLVFHIAKLNSSTPTSSPTSDLAPKTKVLRCPCITMPISRGASGVLTQEGGGPEPKICSK